MHRDLELPAVLKSEIVLKEHCSLAVITTSPAIPGEIRVGLTQSLAGIHEPGMIRGLNDQLAPRFQGFPALA